MDIFSFGKKHEFARFPDVWDKREKKFLVQIVEGKDMAAKDWDGLSDPYVKIVYGQGKKNERRTGVYKDTLNPKFSEKELFRLEPNGNNLAFEVWDKDLIIDDAMGVIPIGKVEDKIPPDQVVDKWYNLESRSGKNDKIHGQLRIRFYYSLLKETRSRAEIFEDNKRFTYDPIVPRLKSGDLIVFDTVGLLPSLIKITSGSPYAHVGIVVRLPNKYTKKEELYLVELTNNLEGFLDAFKEAPGNGVCIFRLFERLHQIHCTNAWYFPLRQALNQEEEEKLREFVNKSHSGAFPVDPRWQPPVQFTNVIDTIDKQLTKKGDYTPIYVAEFVNNAFKYIGRPLLKEASFNTLAKPADFLEGEDSKFDHPVLIVTLKPKEEEGKEGEEKKEEKKESTPSQPSTQTSQATFYPPSTTLVPKQQVHVCPACGTQSVETIMVPQLGSPPTSPMVGGTQYPLTGYPQPGYAQPGYAQPGYGGTMSPTQMQQVMQTAPPMSPPVVQAPILQTTTAPIPPTAQPPMPTPPKSQEDPAKH